MPNAHTAPAAAAANVRHQTHGDEGWNDRPRLVRWAHWATFGGFIFLGLSLVGIVLALLAKRNGEFGAATALRNAVAVTVFLVLLFGVFIIIASLL